MGCVLETGSGGVSVEVRSGFVEWRWCGWVVGWVGGGGGGGGRVLGGHALLALAFWY